jgi:hypothetical protein
MAALAMSLAATWLVTGAIPALADPASGHTRAEEWWLGSLGITRAWSQSRGSGVIVAVLSDGIAPAQADLTGSVITGPDLTRSGRAADSPYFGQQGTAAASLIAGHGHGPRAAAGVIGVAPAAKVLSVQVTLSSTDPMLAEPAVTDALPTAIARGIRYAVRHGAKVIDLPLDPAQVAASITPAPPAGAAPAPTPAPALIDGSAAEQAAIEFALRRDVVLVAPAGDNGAGTDAVNYPAAYRGVIAVGAVGGKLRKAAFSSGQPYVTLTAPGAGVIAANASGGYSLLNSTSAASAIVAGTAALIDSEFPNLTPAQVTSALRSGAVARPHGGHQSGAGFGSVNALSALARAERIDAPATQRADAGALPRRSPSPPAVPSATTALAPRLLRYAVIAAAVLIVLLMLIIVYWAARRQRMRREAPAEARWQSPAAGRYGGAGDAPAGIAAGAALRDPMPDMFAAHTPASYGPSGGLPSSRLEPASFAFPASGREVSGYGDYGGRAGSAAPAVFGSGSSDRGDEGAPAAATGSERPAALSAFSRAASRPPQVSGSPPWDPAPPPDSELSWATSPPPHPLTRRVPAAAAQARPPEPPWPTSDAPAWADDEAGIPDWGGENGDDPFRGSPPGEQHRADDQDSEPESLWNPTASTETFPAVPHDQD